MYKQKIIIQILFLMLKENTSYKKCLIKNNFIKIFGNYLENGLHRKN